MDQQSFPVPRNSNQSQCYEVDQDGEETEKDLAITHGTKANKGQELPKETNEQHSHSDEESISSHMFVLTQLEEIGPLLMNECLIEKQDLESPPEKHKYPTRSWKHRARLLKHSPSNFQGKKKRTQLHYDQEEVVIVKRSKCNGLIQSYVGEDLFWKWRRLLYGPTKQNENS